MNFYSAIRPLYLFSKCTGALPFTLTDSRFTILKRDNTLFCVFLIILTIIVAPIIQGNVKYLDWSAITIANIFISFTNIANVFIIQITLFHNRETIMMVLEKILLADEDLFHTDYKYTRHYVVQVFIIYTGMFIVLFVCDVAFIIYVNTCVVTLVSKIYGYIFYLLHMSSSLLIFLLLKEMSVRFHSTNTYCRSLRQSNNVTTVIKFHREFRELSRTVAAVLEVIMLGKFLSASMSSLYTLLEVRRQLEEAESIEDYVATLPTITWGCVLILEMVALVYHFCDLRYEVRDHIYKCDNINR